jgi:hypothetical protein
MNFEIKKPLANVNGFLNQTLLCAILPRDNSAINGLLPNFSK